MQLPLVVEGLALRTLAAAATEPVLEPQLLLPTRNAISSSTTQMTRMKTRRTIRQRPVLLPQWCV